MAVFERAYPHDAPVLAPDGSVIHELAAGERGSMVHCTLPAGAVTRPVRHRTVQELWYVLEGEGRLWREAGGGHDEFLALVPGVSALIPTGTAFQFRNDGPGDLRLVIVTMPPWPGSAEAEPARGPWEATT